VSDELRHKCDESPFLSHCPRVMRVLELEVDIVWRSFFYYCARLSWSGVGGGVLVDDFHLLVFLGLTWSCPFVVYYILW
jgi:hypothetical protein